VVDVGTKDTAAKTAKKPIGKITKLLALLLRDTKQRVGPKDCSVTAPDKQIDYPFLVGGLKPDHYPSSRVPQRSFFQAPR